MKDATRLMGHPYRISGHVVHGRKLGRSLGFKTLNQRFAHWKPAASGIFTVLVYGLSERPLPGVANLGVRPSLDPRDELKYDSLDALTAGIQKDCQDARAYFPG